MRPLAAMLLLVALEGLPAQKPAARQDASVAQLLLQYEDGWTTALVKRDGAYFRRMLAPGFVYTEDAKLMSRDDVLRDAISGTDTVIAAHNEDMIVHQAGRVTAVVTGILVVQVRSLSKPSTHRYRFTDTWVKGDDRQWQIVAAQDYLIPGK